MTQIAVEAAAPSAPAPARLAVGERLAAIDMLRGLVIAVMALDHVRDFVHTQSYQFDPLDLAHTYPALYATRWITHLCAPTFVCLSGISAYLQSLKGKSGGKLSRFLFTRGLWLIFLEVTVVGWGWSFYPLGIPFLQVIWAIGWSMLALSALVWLPQRAVLAVGLAIILLHNLTDGVTPEQFGGFAWFWIFLHQGGLQYLNGSPVALDFYPVLPWIGVMAFGYGIGDLFAAPAPRRDRAVALIGAAMLLLFVALRAGNAYGDPKPWSPQGDLTRSIMSFLDVQKYPPSLLYDCATLGVVFLLFPLLARLKGFLGKYFLTLGSVPLFAYVVHIYLAHAFALALAAATGHDPSIMIDAIRKVFTEAQLYVGYGVALPWVYVVWLCLLAVLYPLCLWWASVKRNRRDWWLSYL